MSMSPPRSCDVSDNDTPHPMNRIPKSVFQVKRGVFKRGLATKTAKEESRFKNVMRSSTIRINATANSLVFNAKCGLCRITPGNTNTVFSFTTCTMSCIMCVTGENDTGIISERIYPETGGVYMVPACKKYVIYWKRLKRAHSPVFKATDLDDVFIGSWSVSNSLMVQKRDEKSYNGLVVGPGCLRCIDCGKAFGSFSEWTAHFATFRIPQNLPWYSVSISDGKASFTKSQIKMSPGAVPMPHETDTERSLVDKKYSEPLMTAALEKLEQFVYSTDQ